MTKLSVIKTVFIMTLCIISKDLQTFYASIATAIEQEASLVA